MEDCSHAHGRREYNCGVMRRMRDVAMMIESASTGYIFIRDMSQMKENGIFRNDAVIFSFSTKACGGALRSFIPISSISRADSHSKLLPESAQRMRELCTFTVYMLRPSVQPPRVVL